MSKTIVIIPTYNEKENIQKIVRTVLSRPHSFSVLVVDDNSPDGTGAIVESLTAEFPSRLFLLSRKRKLGLGTAYIRGFKWALAEQYDYIFEMDADFSHNPDDLIRLYSACADGGADLAIGSRYVTGGSVVNWPLRRWLLSYAASVYVRLITDIKVRDTTAGFKCYKRRVLEAIDLDSIRSVGYAFQVEMTFTAWKQGFAITEIPIVFTERTEGTSKVSTGIVGEGVLGVIEMKWKSLFRNYEQSQ